MKKIINGWKIDWEKGSGDNYGIRYHKYHKKGQDNLQLSKFRKADDFDKSMGHKYKWHGKWYVNLWHPETEKLFKTKAQALKFAKDYMKKH